jgi:hypothetical protein
LHGADKAGGFLFAVAAVSGGAMGVVVGTTGGISGVAASADFVSVDFGGSIGGDGCATDALLG